MTATRERFISAATQIFAERGFYGTSIAAIADTLPFTKQALLHHFGSKEKLYAEVLKRISERLMGELNAVRARVVDPRARFEETFVEFYRFSIEHGDDTQLLMRELLDNRQRAESSRAWFLKPFLETLVDMVISIPGTDIRSQHQALIVVYQLLGAMTYFVVSQPTLEQMLGAKEFAQLHTHFENELRKLVAARLELSQTAAS